MPAQSFKLVMPVAVAASGAMNEDKGQPFPANIFAIKTAISVNLKKRQNISSLLCKDFLTYSFFAD